jgi:excisionase family DNA binding protein
MQTNESSRSSAAVERKTISIMKACELVGVSRRTIYNWIAGGKVEYVRTAGGSVRIFVDTLWRDPERRPGDLAAKEVS